MPTFIAVTLRGAASVLLILFGSARAQDAAAPGLTNVSSSVWCDPNSCRFSPEVNGALESLLSEDALTGTYVMRPISVFGQRITPRLSSDAGEGISPTTTITVRLPQPVVWNDLHIVGLERRQGHEFLSSALIFREGVDVVRLVFRQFGVPTPPPPAFRELESDECAASVGIESHALGVAFVHTGWC